MGLLDKLFGKKEDSMTDDEKELREYEENVYRAESGVTEGCHAEFIITCASLTANGKTLLEGSVTEGTFRTGDEVRIVLRSGQEVRSAITAISVSLRPCDTATEGQNAELWIDFLNTKLIKRNDIVKKIIPEEAAEKVQG